MNNAVHNNRSVSLYPCLVVFGHTSVLCAISLVLMLQATAVFENIGNGEIMCASCPDAKTIVTAGTSTVSRPQTSVQ